MTMTFFLAQCCYRKLNLGTFFGVADCKKLYVVNIFYMLFYFLLINDIVHNLNFLEQIGFHSKSLHYG